MAKPKEAIKRGRPDHPNTAADWIMAQKIEVYFKASYNAIANKGLLKDWGIYDDYWSNDQNPIEDENDPGSVTNIIHPVIESQVADLVSSPIDMLVKGREPSDNAYAKWVKYVLQWIWDNNQMEIKQDQFERHRLKYGTGIWKVYFDPDGNRGRGKIVIDVVSPEKFYPDPKVKNPHKIQDGDYVIQVSEVSLSYLRRRFGKRAKSVRPRSMNRYNTNINNGEELDNEINQTAIGMANLMECWIKDDDLKLRLVYMADDVILWDSTWPDKDRAEDEESESFYQHGLYPFVVVPCYLKDGSFHGMGDVEMLKPTQDLVNDLDDQVRLNARLMGNIQIVVGLASGINPNKWTNKVGLRVPARDHNAWRMVEPPNIPPMIMDRRELGKREAELISGRTDVVEGRKPAGVRAASAILALQEAGNRRVNHKRLMSQVGLSSVLTIAFEHFKEFFDMTMPIPVAGKEVTDPDNFIWLSGETFKAIPKLVPDLESAVGDDGKQPLKNLTETDENGTEVTATKEAEFDFSVTIGAGLPRNKAFLYQAVVELHREQLLTTEEGRHFMKEMIDWPLIDPMNPYGSFSQQQPVAPGQPQQPANPNAQVVPPGSGGVDPRLLQQLAATLGGVANG